MIELGSAKLYSVTDKLLASWLVGMLASVVLLAIFLLAWGAVTYPLQAVLLFLLLAVPPVIGYPILRWINAE